MKVTKNNSSIKQHEISHEFKETDYFCSTCNRQIVPLWRTGEEKKYVSIGFCPKCQSEIAHRFVKT